MIIVKAGSARYIRRTCFFTAACVIIDQTLVKVCYSAENPGKAEVVWPEQAE
jgi:hypothetical protein